jgi:uncharacterized membrane protein YdjX (TVP38/TMEM64 family)
MTDFFITLCGAFVGSILGMWAVGWYVSGWDRDDA